MQTDSSHNKAFFSPSLLKELVATKDLPHISRCIAGSSFGWWHSDAWDISDTYFEYVLPPVGYVTVCFRASNNQLYYAFAVPCRIRKTWLPRLLALWSSVLCSWSVTACAIYAVPVSQKVFPSLSGEREIIQRLSLFWHGCQGRK